MTPPDPEHEHGTTGRDTTLILIAMTCLAFVVSTFERVI